MIFTSGKQWLLAKTVALFHVVRLLEGKVTKVALKYKIFANENADFCTNCDRLRISDKNNKYLERITLPTSSYILIPSSSITKDEKN